MRKIAKGAKVTWIDIQEPTEEDVEYLRKNFKFHPLVLGEIIPSAWRAKVEVFPHYLFFVIHHPEYYRETRETKPKELDIIVTKDTLITVRYQTIAPLKSVFERAISSKTKKIYLGRGTGYLLFYLQSALWKSSLVKLTRINRKLDEIERRIFQGHERQMVEEISRTKADIIDFWRIIGPQGAILESFKSTEPFFGKDMEHYFEDLLADYTQAKNDLRTYKETIESLEDTNNALLTHKTNETVKILTMFSVILLPLTLLASIWGMNTTYLPFVSSPFDFWVVMGLMASGISVMVGYFKHKGWM